MLTRLAERRFIIILLILVVIFPAVANLIPNALAVPEVYRLAAFPFRSQEGTIVSLVLDVSSVASPTTYQFVFGVQDPSTHVWISVPENYTTLTGQQEFVLVVNYPSSSFNATGGVNSFVGVYAAAVSQIKPTVKNNVAGTFFIIGLTDKSSYQRTQSVSIKATSYRPLEPVTVTITTSPGNVVVYSHPSFADPSGVVTDSWTIPANANTSQSYIVTVTGMSTNKSPADIDSFTVTTAVMTVASLNTNKATYQRTETVSVSFGPVYPSGVAATTGSANVTIIRPNNSASNITASYDPTTHLMVANFKLPVNAATGTWTARLGINYFDDGNGNKGPTTAVSTTFAVQVATLAVTTSLGKTTFVINERIPLNSTIQYPDGSILGSSGSVAARLSLTGGTFVAIFPLVFDTATNQWEGLYIPTGSEPTGLWSLSVTGNDTASPINTGTSTNPITLNKRATSTSVSCNPTQITVGQQVTCTVTVTDTDTGTAITPSGQVTISPSFDNPQLCNLLSGSGSSASCSAIFSTRPQSVGSNTITASYGGDPHEALSSTSSSVTIQQPLPTGSGSGNNLFTLQLFWYALIAAIIAAITAVFLGFRHRTTHTKLKIDLEAVKSEAGKIENEAFFQSVKDQLTKEKDETESTGADKTGANKGNSSK